eukprot:scaffold27217_cov175-Skeletonema_marinoi.AAC.2
MIDKILARWTVDPTRIQLIICKAADWTLCHYCASSIALETLYSTVLNNTPPSALLAGFLPLRRSFDAVRPILRGG